MEFFSYNERFTPFGNDHLVVLMFIFLCCTLLPLWAKRSLNESGRIRFARAWSWMLSGWVIFWTLTRVALGDFDPRTDLPLDICNILALVLPILSWKPRKSIHEILYFWILAGTIQAVFMPYLYDGFPAFTFFKYWFVHGGLVVYAVYTTAALDFLPGSKGIIRAFILFQGYALAVLGCNLLLGSNYVYLLEKPPTASPLDYLGPWPWYVFLAEPIALGLFGLVYLPAAFLRQKKL